MGGEAKLTEGIEKCTGGGRETHNKEPDKPIKGRKMSQKDGRDKPKERYVNLFLVFEKIP